MLSQATYWCPNYENASQRIEKSSTLHLIANSMALAELLSLGMLPNSEIFSTAKGVGPT